MDTTEEQTEGRSGINNFYYGHVTNVINLKLTKEQVNGGGTGNNIARNLAQTFNGDVYYGQQQEAKRKKTREMPSWNIVAKAISEVQYLFWGNSSYGIAFCVYRDGYHMENNASLFERQLADKGIQIPAGTINTAFCRNPWMKYHIDRWAEVGASERAMRLKDELINQTEKLLTDDKKGTDSVIDC